MSAIDYTFEQGIATITINNPPQNRLTSEVFAGFMEAFGQLTSEPGLRAVLLRSEGPDFSFGGDVTAWPGRTGEEVAEELKGGIALTNAFENLPVPVIVEIQGHCAGGGMEMALRGDILIASEDATFQHPEKTLGIFTLLGGVQRVAERVGRTRAMQWALTAEHIGAQQALDAGLINQVVPRSELSQTVRAWLDQYAVQGPTLAHAAHKAILRAWSNGGIEAADALMADWAVTVFNSEDAKQAIPSAVEAFNAGRPRPDFPFQGK